MQLTYYNLYISSVIFYDIIVWLALDIVTIEIHHRLKELHLVDVQLFILHPVFISDFFVSWVSQTMSATGVHKIGIRGIQDTRQIGDGKTNDIENNDKNGGSKPLT